MWGEGLGGGEGAGTGGWMMRDRCSLSVSLLQQREGGLAARLLAGAESRVGNGLRYKTALALGTYLPTYLPHARDTHASLTWP